MKSDPLTLPVFEAPFRSLSWVFRTACETCLRPEAAILAVVVGLALITIGVMRRGDGA